MKTRACPGIRFFRTLLAAAALVLGTGLQAQPRERPYSLTEPTGEELGKVQPLMDQNATDAAIAIVDAQLAKVPANSYDAAILLQVKAQILLQSARQLDGIEPLERALALSDAHSPPYFEPRVTLEFTYFLAQLYYQLATTTKDSRVIATSFQKAEAYMSRWMREAPKPAAEPLLFYASLLYNYATQDGREVDLRRVERSLEIVETALGLDARPKENLYLLKLAGLTQLNRYAEAAEILELLLSRDPKRRSFWEQLAAIYLSLGQDTRAAVTVERAQSHGFLNSPKDNFNLVGIYFNLGQFEKAAELLETGIKDGSLESDIKNWELLSYSYQQLKRDLKSLDALKRAIVAMPGSGQLEYMVAQGYFSLDRNADAIRHAESAVRKGNLNRPHQAYLFLAYLSFEAKQLEVALDAAERAVAYPEGAEEGARMKAAIQDAIAERAARLEKM